MPRTWGYIIIVLATVIGFGALLLPLPETVEIAKIEAPRAASPVTRRSGSKPAQARRQAKSKPAPKPAVKPPTPKRFPMQDTTKTRQLVDPNKKS